MNVKMIDNRTTEYEAEEKRVTDEYAQAISRDTGERASAVRLAERLRSIADEMRSVGASSMTPHELLACYANDVDKVADSLMFAATLGSESNGDTEPENADSREKLEADVRKHYAYSTTTLMYPPSANKTTDMLHALPVDTVIGWLARQAAITERENLASRLDSYELATMIEATIKERNELEAKLAETRELLSQAHLDWLNDVGEYEEIIDKLKADLNTAVCDNNSLRYELTCLAERDAEGGQVIGFWTCHECGAEMYGFENCQFCGAHKGGGRTNAPMNLENTNWSKLFGNPRRATDFFIENCCKTCFGCPLPSDVCDFTYSESTKRKRIFAWLESEVER